MVCVPGIPEYLRGDTMDSNTRRSSSLNEPLKNYEHESMFLSVTSDPMEVLKAVDESAADPIVSDVDRQIETICREYMIATEEQRAELRRMATNYGSLLHFAHRMAIRAMRTDNIDYIRLGLISIVLENACNDPRETISNLAMLNHAASYIKCSFAALAEDAVKVSSPGMAEYIREFVARDCESQSLEAMGLREVHDLNGPRIEVGWI